MAYNTQDRLSEITIETYTNGVKSNIVTQEYTYDSSGMKVRQVESIDANAMAPWMPKVPLLTY